MTRQATPAASRRYLRESAEFGRVTNLSDAVFAIAMTLLVLTLDVPDVAPDLLAGALADRLPQLIAINLALLVAAWQPVGGLVVAAVSGTTVGVLMGVYAPQRYREWG